MGPQRETRGVPKTTVTASSEEVTEATAEEEVPQKTMPNVPKTTVPATSKELSIVAPPTNSFVQREFVVPPLWRRK